MTRRPLTAQFKKNRSKMIGSAWKDNETECRCCGRKMYFPKHETANEFLSRVDRRGRLNRRIFLALREVTGDHIKRISEGGSDNWHNLRLICRLCNQKREGAPSTMGVEEYEDHE